MRLKFVGKDPDSNPTGYRTDRGSWVIQTCVEIPDRMIQFFVEDRGPHQ